MRSTLLVTTVLLAACSPPEAIGEQEAAIVGGSTDTGDPSVVLVHGNDGSTSTTTCTGSIIAPRVVLTAAHCVTNKAYGLSIGLNYLYDFTDSASAGALVPVESSTIAPGYDPTVIPHLHDIAIIRVGTNLGKALPYHAGAPDATWYGQPLRIVGYGRTGAKTEDQNMRRAVMTEIFDIRPNDLAIDNGKQPCVGDSGGPAFLTLNGVSTIVGVAGSASPDCMTSAHYGRIDTDITFINAAVAGSSGGGTPGATSVAVHATQTSAGCNATGRDTTSGLWGSLLVLLALLHIRSRKPA